MYQIPIRHQKKKQPDYPLTPYTERSAEEYEKYNTPRPEQKK